MEELEMLEIELVLLKDNIQRLKKYRQENIEGYHPCNSAVVGEFKHRVVVLKSRLTLVLKLTTSSLFK